MTTTTNSTTSPNPDVSPALQRLLPQDIEAERALLGALLLDAELTADVIDQLGDAGADAFARESHQHIYRALLRLHDANQPFDAHLIRNELILAGHSELASNDVFAGFIGAVASASRAPAYAHVIYEKYLLRRLVHATDIVMQAAFDATESTRDVLDRAEKLIFEVTERGIGGSAQNFDELIKEAFEKIESRGDGALTGEPTGFVELDEMTCGLQAGELIIIAARPSMGKTAFGLNVAEYMATKDIPVLFFSLEMSRQQVAQRVLCSQARVDSQKLRRGRHDSRDLDDLKRAADRLCQAPLYVDDTASLTLQEMRARSRVAHRRHHIRAIFVDYLQLMRVPKSESRQIEVAACSRGLKALAKELNLPVVAMAQLNRNPEERGRAGNRPRMSDLRESGAIEQDADLIGLLHREQYYRDPGSTEGLADDEDQFAAELIIAKQRNGPVGTVHLHWNPKITRFDTLAPGGDLGGIPATSDVTPF